MRRIVNANTRLVEIMKKAFPPCCDGPQTIRTFCSGVQDGFRVLYILQH